VVKIVTRGVALSSSSLSSYSFLASSTSFIALALRKCCARYPAGYSFGDINLCLLDESRVNDYAWQLIESAGLPSLFLDSFFECAHVRKRRLAQTALEAGISQLPRILFVHYKLQQKQNKHSFLCVYGRRRR
jgi:hypothetical protein